MSASLFAPIACLPLRQIEEGRAMEHAQPCSAQTIADAIIEGATLVEVGRIAALARQGLEDPSSLTTVQARQVFGAFLLLFDPLVRLRGETAPPPLIPLVRLPLPVSVGGSRAAS